MIKSFFLLTLISFNLSAQEFTGCGLYLFKGVLKKDVSAPKKISYIIHEGSDSQMIFHLKNEKDIVTLFPFLNKPTTFKAKISQKMDGTKGELSEPKEISRRFSNPLLSHDTEIVRIESLKCN